MEIKIYNRTMKKNEIEKVLGGELISWLYSTSLGRFLEKVLAYRPVSQLFGLTQNSKRSINKIDNFIKDFEIKMEDFENKINYTNFNDFFIRKFRQGVRPFILERSKMPAFCEARYFGFKSVDEKITFPVKGQFLSAKSLIDNDKWFNFFLQGP